MDNILNNLPDAARMMAEEQFHTLLTRPGVRIERIVSHGQITPVDAPYVQPVDEWVLLLSGAARLWTATDGERDLLPGDHLLIPAHVPHRVTWTLENAPTIWLAIHFEDY